MRHSPRSACALGLLTLTAAAALADPFIITELVTLGGVGSRGVAVSRSGLVCGESNRLIEGYMVATA